ncbi:MAG: F0F1 ATP synthase subunit A [Actinobacteria bacterium]|nr:F0F1 ATP synthase subunit A [Actinomycetota bacterium]
MELLEEFELHPVFNLPKIFGVDLSITKAVIVMWVAVALTSVLVIYAGRKRGLVVGGLKGGVEAILEFIRNEIVIENIGREGLVWYPFITALFFFILFNNLLGLLPGSFTPTSNINTTATLAIIVFLSVIVQGMIKKGPIKYWLKLVPKGVPAFLGPFLFIIEFVSLLAKPLSLAVRLFANMFAGHVVLGAFLGLIFFFGSYFVAPAPLLITVALRLLEVMFSAIQAYIFAMLSSMYIGAAIHDEH